MSSREDYTALRYVTVRAVYKSDRPFDQRLLNELTRDALEEAAETISEQYPEKVEVVLHAVT